MANPPKISFYVGFRHILSAAANPGSWAPSLADGSKRSLETKDAHEARRVLTAGRSRATGSKPMLRRSWCPNCGPVTSLSWTICRATSGTPCTNEPKRPARPYASCSPANAPTTSAHADATQLIETLEATESATPKRSFQFWLDEAAMRGCASSVCWLVPSLAEIAASVSTP